jgi:hypothetical protein
MGRAAYERRNMYKSDMKFSRKADRISEKPAKQFQRDMNNLQSELNNNEESLLKEYVSEFSKRYNIESDKIINNKNSRILVLFMLKSRCDDALNKYNKQLEILSTNENTNPSVINDINFNKSLVNNMINDIDACYNLSYLKDIEFNSTGLDENIKLFTQRLTEETDEKKKKDNIELISLFNDSEFFNIVKSFLSISDLDELDSDNIKIYYPLALLNRLLIFINNDENLLNHRFFIVNTLKNLSITDLTDPLLIGLIEEINNFNFSTEEIELIKSTNVTEDIKDKENEIEQLEQQEEESSED